MGWESRGAGRYYYTKSRVGGRVVSEYVPSEYAILFQHGVQQRAVERDDDRRRREQEARLHVVLDSLERETWQLTRAVLLAGGFHTHRRQWRRRQTPDEMPKKLLPTVHTLTAEGDAFALLKRCNTDNPKPADVAKLRAWLRDDPDPYRRALDLAAAAERDVIEAAAGTNGLGAELAALDAERLRNELAGAGEFAECPPLERLLIRHAVVCWLTLQSVQRRYTGATAGEYRLVVAEHYEKRLTAAQRRFTRAVETLARVRRLTRSAVQLNVAAAGGTFQQVNAG